MSTRPRHPAPSTPAPGKLPLPELAAMKRDGRRIVMVTAYDYPSGKVASEAGVELVLVGDSAAMTVLGHDVDRAGHHRRDADADARRRARLDASAVIGDLPFMSYQVDDRDAMVTAGRFIKEGGADAVKMEGAGPTLDRILAVTRAGIPVMGHLGLTPQTATALGGFKAQGRTADAALQLIDDALAIEAAGAFSLVLECVPAAVAQAVTERLRIPTIGIGAGAGCDGQVLVYHDLLGYGEPRAPRFVKRYADLHGAALDGIRRYAADVRSGAFPALEHTYTMPAEELARFEDALVPANPLFD